MSNLLDGEPASSLFVPVGSPADTTDRRRKAIGSGSGPGPHFLFQCSSIPDDTPEVMNTSYTLETDQAVQLGINYLGTGNLDVDKKMKVFVRQYAKYGECESTDGKATLRYGASWCATVVIDEADASGKVNFAIVAASATLKSLSVQVSITHSGFAPDDRLAIDQASQAAMEATAAGLNVSSFVKFSEQVEKAVQAAMKAKVVAPLHYLGYELHKSDELLDSVARTFALSYIARGVGCLESIADFPVKNPRTEKVIRDTYVSLSSTPCSAEDKTTQLAAQRLLGGIKVGLPFWR